MAFPTLTYNASTGSDTAASGAGPATAITGSGAAHTSGAASTTIEFDNSPDLSGVAADGSAALWLNTGAGTRHLSKITAVDDGADTVTVEDSFNISGGSPVDYAIGGKRLSHEADTTNADWVDAKSGWTLEYNDGTYAYTIPVNPQVGDDTDGPITFKSTNVHGAILSVAGALDHFSMAASFSYIHILDFKFERTGADSNASNALLVNTKSKFRFAGNECDGTGGGPPVFLNVSCTFEIEDNEFYGSDQSTTLGLVHLNGSRPRGSIHRNIFRTTSDYAGIRGGSVSSFVGVEISENTFYDLADVMILDAPIDSDSFWCAFRNNTAFDISGNGVSIDDATADEDSLFIHEGNIYSGIVGTAFLASAETGKGSVVHNDYNCMHNNGTNYSNVTAGDNDVNADPKFKNTGSGTEDLYLQADSPCISAMPSGPSNVPTPATKSIGALNFTASGGGGSGGSAKKAGRGGGVAG